MIIPCDLGVSLYDHKSMRSIVMNEWDSTGGNMEHL